MLYKGKQRVDYVQKNIFIVRKCIRNDNSKQPSTFIASLYKMWLSTKEIKICIYKQDYRFNAKLEHFKGVIFVSTLFTETEPLLGMDSV